MAKHTIVIALDALSSQDLQKRLNFLPNIAQLMATGSWLSDVKSVYPTLSSVTHTSMVTGVYPRRHGIINATHWQSDRIVQETLWQAKYIKVPTLYQAAQRAGLTVATFMWPVTAGASDINWYLGETSFNQNRAGKPETILRASSPVFLFEIVRKFGQFRQHHEQPSLDDYMTAIAADTIRTKRPNLTLIRLADLAEQGKRFGMQTQYAWDAMERLDQRIGQLIAAAHDAAIFSETNFVIIGSQVQKNSTHQIALNQIFAQHGWLRTNHQGRILKNWQALAKQAGGSAYVYLRDSSLLGQIYQLINQLPGIKTIYDHHDIVALGADASASLMIEAQPGYYFVDDLLAQVINSVDSRLAREGVGHNEQSVSGYHPDGTQETLPWIMSGPDIKAGHQFKLDAELVDLAPTLADMLGITFTTALDGQTIYPTIQSK